MCLICDYDEFTLWSNSTTVIDCDGCPKLTIIYPIRGLKKLICSGCHNLTTIYPIKGLKELYCAKCPNLESIPNIKGLETLTCSESQYIESIPAIEGLKNLSCYDCYYLDNIPFIEGLEFIVYSDNLKQISKIKSLKCVFYKSKYIIIEKIIKLQRWFRNIKRSKYLLSDEFKQFFYSPTGFGGYKSKLRSLKHFEQYK